MIFLVLEIISYFFFLILSWKFGVLYVMRLWILFMFSVFSRQSPYIGLACRSWPPFVDCGFKDNSVSRALAVLFWFHLYATEKLDAIQHCSLILKPFAILVLVSLTWGSPPRTSYINLKNLFL